MPSACNFLNSFEAVSEGILASTRIESSEVDPFFVSFRMETIKVFSIATSKPQEFDAETLAEAN
jgi:hypothetical protein